MTTSTRMVKLGRIARTISGVGFPHSFQGSGTGEIPFLKVSDLSLAENSQGVREANNWVNRSTLSELGGRVSPVGSVVFPKVGAALLKNQRRVLLREAAMDNNLMSVVPRIGDAAFLMYAMTTIDMGELSGSGPLPYVSESQVKDLWVHFPEVEEQWRIADFLDAEVGRIGSIMAARRSQMRIFEEREASFISERLFPGSIGRASGEFPWPWLPRAEESPILVRLGYLCHVQGGVTVDASRGRSETDVTRPYLRVANVKADRLELGSVTEITVPKAVADRSALQPGDVLMTEGGDIDKLGRGTVWSGELPGALHQNHVFALRPDPERLDAEYLALLTRSLHGRCYFEATGVKSTNLASTSSSKVKSFPIPLVSLAEQHKAAVEVNGSLAEIGRLRSALVRQIDLLEERKRALITAAVTGQIDVTTARGADVS